MKLQDFSLPTGPASFVLLVGYTKIENQALISLSSLPARFLRIPFFKGAACSTHQKERETATWNRFSMVTDARCPLGLIL
jgi:hypothetical protein